MNHAYRKEWQLTLVAFLVTLLLTHFYPVYFLFKGLTEMTILGYPAHYFLTLVMGWIVMIPLYWIYIKLSEDIDREIEASTGDTIESNVSTEGAPR